MVIVMMITMVMMALVIIMMITLAPLRLRLFSDNRARKHNRLLR